MVCFFCTAVFLIAGFARSEESVAPEVQQTLEKAAASFNASQFTEALDTLKELYGKHPETLPPR
ncbi:MAG: hypothetical protein LBU65_03435, partial [Planctomycetaceae bacterium]|nr:hypothetical protein [Planctomycetaceae bacterium]